MSFLERLKRLLGGLATHADHPGGNGKVSTACKPISCMEAMERLQEYLDGELNGVSHEEVAHHFSQCQRCYPHLQLEERFKDLLHRSQEAETCPDRVRAQVLELLATEADGSD